MKKYKFLKTTISLALVLSLAAIVCGCDVLEYFENAKSKSLEGANFVGRMINRSNNDAVAVEESVIDNGQLKFLTSYSSLNAEQQRIYRIVHSAAQDMVSGFFTLGECKKSYNTDITLAFRAVTSDFPEMFWIPYTYLMSSDKSDNSIKISLAFDYSEDGNSNSYSVPKEDCPEMAASLENRVTQILGEAAALSGEYEKELYFHDLLCDTVEYKQDEVLSFTSYGALINNSAVCEGYSRAFQLLCKRSGIICELVCGDADGEGHMWNAVQIGGNWYLTDVTWDDLEEYVSRYYFNMTNDKMSDDHAQSKTYTEISEKSIDNGEIYNFNLRTCNSDNENYFVKEGAYLSDTGFAEAAAVIEKENAVGRKYAELMFDSNSVQKAFEADRENYVLKLQRNLNYVELSQISILHNVVTFYW